MKHIRLSEEAARRFHVPRDVTIAEVFTPTGQLRLTYVGAPAGGYWYPREIAHGATKRDNRSPEKPAKGRK